VILSPTRRRRKIGVAEAESLSRNDKKSISAVGVGSPEQIQAKLRAALPKWPQRSACKVAVGASGRCLKVHVEHAHLLHNISRVYCVWEFS
jgi:hypothetical protein